MHTFELTLYKKNLRGEFKGHSAKYPEKWNELTTDQLLFVSKIMGKQLAIENFNIVLLKNFLKIKDRYFHMLNGAEVAELAESISFILDKKELTTQQLPEITVKRFFKTTTLYGPTDAMLDLTFEQFFGYCEPALNSYVKNKDEYSLNFLVASLYTFEKGKFVPGNVEEILKIVKKMKPNYKIAILLFYLGSKDYFAFRFPKLFKQNKAKKAKKVSDLYFIELTDQLNNENLSNNSQIKQTNIIEAFIRLTKMIEASEKIKK